MNVSLHHWHLRWYWIKHLNDWIPPLMYIFSRRRIQMKPVSDWLHGKLEICGNISPLLTMWQPSSSAQNTMPRQLIPAFCQFSWHRRSLQPTERVMFGNPFYLNAVKTTWNHSWWCTENTRMDPAQKNPNPPYAYISVVNELLQQLFSLLTMCIRLWRW